MTFRSVIAFAHQLLQEHIFEGDSALDGTAGNGNDTLFLAQTVGPKGRVYAFDVQEAAIHATRERLIRHDVAQRVQLIQKGHEHLNKLLPAELKHDLAAAMFNLGYLPGGDETRITQPDTTMRALSAVLHWLRPNGILCIVVYPGHQNGQQEASAVATWARTLSGTHYQVLHYQFIQATKSPSPFLIAISQKK